MKKCWMIMPEGGICGRPEKEHGFVLAGEDDGTLLAHPMVPRATKAWREEISQRWFAMMEVADWRA